MTHVRQILRNAVAAEVTGLTITGSNVFKSRVYPLGPEDLPCLLVMSAGDQVEPLTSHRLYVQLRKTDMRIEAIVRGVSGFDDLLDDICEEVESAIAESTDAMIRDMVFLGTSIEFDGTSEQPIGRAIMVFSKDLSTMSNDPGTAL